jgi:hypothetical protein
MIIYVNGDSYAAMSDGKKYSEFLGKNFDCDFVDSAIPGSSNARIFRTSLRDLMALKKKYDKIVAVISLSFPIRTELWDSAVINNHFKNDGEFVSIQPTNSKNWFTFKTADRHLPKHYIDYANQWLIWYNIEAETTKLLKEILLLATWCKHNKIKYVIFSSTLQEPVDLASPFIKSFYEEVIADSHVIDIFKFSFTEWCLQRGHTPIDQHTQEINDKIYNIGHHGERAHQDFASFLTDNYLT